MDGFEGKVQFVWQVADLLRGDYRPAEYRSVILPLLVLRRLDAVLEPTKGNVLDTKAGSKVGPATRTHCSSTLSPSTPLSRRSRAVERTQAAVAKAMSRCIAQDLDEATTAATLLNSGSSTKWRLSTARWSPASTQRPSRPSDA